MYIYPWATSPAPSASPPSTAQWLWSLRPALRARHPASQLRCQLRAGGIAGGVFEISRAARVSSCGGIAVSRIPGKQDMWLDWSHYQRRPPEREFVGLKAPNIVWFILCGCSRCRREKCEVVRVGQSEKSSAFWWRTKAWSLINHDHDIRLSRLDQRNRQNVVLLRNYRDPRQSIV